MSKFKAQCGNCKHWMLMPDCPREYLVEGGHRGAAMDDWPCDMYERNVLLYPEREVEDV
jgi:hypothetical protein